MRAARKLGCLWCRNDRKWWCMKITVALTSSDPAQTIEITKVPFVLGRDKGDFQTEDPKCSSRHAEIGWDGNNFIIRDLGSTNKTYLNSNLLIDVAPIKQGDTFRIGRSVFEIIHLEADSKIDTLEEFLRQATQKLSETSLSSPLRPVLALRAPVVFNIRAGLMRTCKFEISYGPRHITDRHDLDLFLLDEAISNFMYEIKINGTTLILSAIDHSPPFTVNGRLTLESALISGDEIKLGSTQILVEPIDVLSSSINK